MNNQHDYELDSPAQPVAASGANFSEQSAQPSLSEPIVNLATDPDDSVSLDSHSSDNYISTSQEETRATIALVFTYFFLSIVTITLLGPFVVYIIEPNLISDPAEMAKNLLTFAASILAGPFGFIVGFYFKQSSNN